MKSKYINPNEYGSLFYDNKEKEYLSNVIDSKRIFRYSRTDYPYVQMAEEKICEIVKSKYCLATTNGTSGIKAALVGIGIKPNDRVLISSYTFLATALAVIALGAIPIPMEVSEETGIDLKDLEEEIKKGCKAIIVVHFQGRCFDLRKIRDISKKNKIYLLEDACQAFGASYNNQYAGTFGDVGIYSFQQFKQISCGEGGAIVTNNEQIYKRIRNYTDMGSVRDRFPNWNSEEALFGENYRMNNLNGAVLYAQLEKYSKIIDLQKQSRIRIMEKLKNIKNIINSKDPSGDTYMNIIINVNDIDKAITLGVEKNIELRHMWSSVYYDNELFRNNNLTDLSTKGKKCIKTIKLISKMLVISIPPILTKEDEKEIYKFILELKSKGILE